MADEIMTSGDFKKYFWASAFLAVICFLAAVVAVSSSGYADVLKTTVAGDGDLYVRHDFRESADLASVANASVAYNYDRTWEGANDPVETHSQFLVIGAPASGGFRNQYVVKTSGVGHKTVYRATALSGDFQGELDFKLTTTAAASEDLKPGEEMVSQISMDTTFGNGTIQGRVWTQDGDINRPATKEELDAVGKFMVNHYLELSEPPETYDDWLSFCASVDRDVIAAYPGVYIEPVWVNGTCGGCGGCGCAKCAGT